MLKVYTRAIPKSGTRPNRVVWSGIKIVIPTPSINPTLEPNMLIMVILEYSSPMLLSMAILCIHFAFIAPYPIKDRLENI